MSDDTPYAIPPLRGCLYCHAENTTTLAPGRKVLGFGSDFPVLKCSHCGAVALLDCDPEDQSHWRIRYRRFNRTPPYYYVALYLGKVGWLSAQEALAASTDGFVQRTRVGQAQSGDLAWLQPVSADPPLPLFDADENVYLTLKAVTLQEAMPAGLLVRANQGAVLDSGKLYVTDRRLHLLGQRRDWSHGLSEVRGVSYDEKSWTITLNAPEQPRQFRGVNAQGQFDAQLVAAVVEALCTATGGCLSGPE